MSTSSVAIGLVDGDARPDVVATTPTNDGRVLVYLTQAAGFAFQPEAAFPAGPMPLAPLLHDANGDGRNDVVVVNHELDGGVAVLLNTTPAGGPAAFAAPCRGLAVSHATDVALADVNNDLVMDFITSSALSDDRVTTLADVEGCPNRPPAADAGGPYTVDEGSSVPLDGTGSSDPGGVPVVLYEWDFDYNGSTFQVDATGPTPTFDAAGLNGPAVRTIGLLVTDELGAVSPVATTTLAINNVAPQLHLGPVAAVNEGDLFRVPVSFTDPGADTWTAAVDFGDGSGLQPLALSGKGMLLQHVYTQPGVYTVTLSVTDSDNQTGELRLQVVVANVAPRLVLPRSRRGVASQRGRLLLRRLRWEDPGTGPWPVEFRCGDGTVVRRRNLSQRSVLLLHAFARAGLYRVRVKVSDTHGGSDQRTFVVRLM